MYESPIEVVYKDLHTKVENDMFTAIQEYGISVDKEELIKALQYDRGQYEKGYHDGLLHGLMREESEWISVEERLPDQYEDVLGFCHYVYESGGVCDLILTMKLTTDGKFVPFNCSPLKEGIVTHWMPLPEPPKGE